MRGFTQTYVCSIMHLKQSAAFHLKTKLKSANGHTATTGVLKIDVSNGRHRKFVSNEQHNGVS